MTIFEMLAVYSVMLLGVYYFMKGCSEHESND